MEHLAIVGYIFAAFGGVFLLALLKSTTESKKLFFIAESFTLCIGMAIALSGVYLLSILLWNYGLMGLVILIAISVMNVMAVKLTGMSFFPKSGHRSKTQSYLNV
jgi:hypothetical protein